MALRALAAGLLATLWLTTPAPVSAPAGSVTHLEFIRFIDYENWVVGQPTSLGVTAMDDDGNAESAFSDTVHVTTSDPAIPDMTIPCDKDFLGLCGVIIELHLFDVIARHPGPLTLTATSIEHPWLRPAVLTVNVAAGPPALFDMTAASPTAPFGKKTSVTLTVRDAFGFPAPSYTGKVHFIGAGGTTLPGDYVFTPADHGVKTFTVVFNDVGTQTVGVADIAGGGFADSVSVSVVDAPRLVLQPWPDPAAAGYEIGVMVTAVNPDDTTFGGYRGTVHFTSSDPLMEATDYTFTGNDAGNCWLSYGAPTFKTGGTQTLTATDLAHPYITGTTSLTVTGGDLDHITLTGLPSTVSAGEVVMFSVRGFDLWGNLVHHGFVTFTTTDAAAELESSGYLRALDGGSRDFPITFKTAGVWSLTVTGGSDTESLTTTVLAAGGGGGGAGARFVTTPIDSPRRAGAPASLTVSIRDRFGNLAPRYAGTMHFTSSDPRAVLPADYRFSARDRGAHTFTGVTLKTAGTHWIRITDTRTPSIAATQGRIVVRGEGDKTKR